MGDAETGMAVAGRGRTYSGRHRPGNRGAQYPVPEHGVWLNPVESFFYKRARSMLRDIQVASKVELKDRILAYLDDINQGPVIHAWTRKIDQVA